MSDLKLGSIIRSLPSYGGFRKKTAALPGLAPSSRAGFFQDPDTTPKKVSPPVDANQRVTFRGPVS